MSNKAELRGIECSFKMLRSSCGEYISRETGAYFMYFRASRLTNLSLGPTRVGSLNGHAV